MKVGDYVTIKVPEVPLHDRQKTWPTRLPAKIIKISGEKIKRYQCACKFGLLEENSNGGMLEPNPAGAISISMEGKLSLRTAMSSLNSGTEIVCQCRKGCSYQSCRCRKAGILCSTRCHKKLRCTNNKFNEFLREGKPGVQNCEFLLWADNCSFL